MGVGAGEVGPGIQSPGTAAGSVPSNLIVGGASETVATIEIPGLSGSADILPASPSTFNDEFDENAAGAPSGWSRTDTSGGSWGALTTCNTSDILSHLHLVCGAGNLFQGVYKLGPGTLPFTVTCKLSDAILHSNFDYAGMWVASQAPGSAGNVYALNFVDGGVIQTQTMVGASGATGSGGNTLDQQPPGYLRQVVSTTGVTPYRSFSGLVWENNGGLISHTFAAGAVYVGLFVSTDGASDNGEAAFDWVRFM